MAIDPIALILKGKALDIWFEIHHPHEPKVAEIQQVLRSMTLEEQKATLNRARTLANYGRQRVLRSMTPQEQKAVDTSEKNTDLAALRGKRDKAIADILALCR